MAKKSRCGAALILLALTLSVSGCDALSDLGILPGSGTGPEQPDPGPLVYIPPGGGSDGNAASIKAKFGIMATGTEGVTAAFKALHAYVAAGGLEDVKAGNVIRLGDWIDLENGLEVDNYNGQGGFSLTWEGADVGDKGSRLRLIVVGINSFHSGRGIKDDNTPTVNGESNGQYNIQVNDATSHVVFHFQNIPVYRPMNESDINTGGYRDSEMRKYLTPVGGDSESGKFLAGLKNAGVPEEALWAPMRMVSAKEEAGPAEIDDLLWLPTEREMFGGNSYSVSADEMPENQARLEYYGNDTIRQKFVSNQPNEWYWEASPYSGSMSFCVMTNAIGTAFASANFAGVVGGCVPAFCVR
jgi:hypothetical protein